MQFVPDEYVQRLLNEMDEAGEEAAAAKALSTYLIERRKILKNQLMMVAATEGVRTVALQERFAYCHPTYSDLIEQLRHAIQDAAHKEGRARLANATFEAWRTLNANHRAAMRG